MTEVKITLTEEHLAEMDRIARGDRIRGRRWLQHAVAIYKDLLEERHRQLQGVRHLRVVEGGRLLSR